MKNGTWILGLACGLGLACASMAAAAPSPELDTLTLKDGRVIQGQVIEESSDTVVVLVDGVKRSFGRNFISKVAYGAGPAAYAGPAPAGQAAPSTQTAPGQPAPPAPPAGTIPSTPPSGNLVQDIALRYQVPASDVVWVREQGIPDSDLAIVFLVAATAQVVPRDVVRLRKEGWSWADIESHYGMDSRHIYYYPGAWYAYPYYWYPGVYAGWGWGWGWGHGWRGGYGYGGGWRGGGHWR